MTPRKIFDSTKKYIKKKYKLDVIVAPLKALDAFLDVNGCIVVNDGLDDWIDRLASLLHELGHLEIQGDSVGSGKKAEAEAELFSAYIMFWLGFTSCMDRSHIYLVDKGITPSMVRSVLLSVEDRANYVLEVISNGVK